jgi:hypothetical protein
MAEVLAWVVITLLLLALFWASGYRLRLYRVRALKQTASTERLFSLVRYECIKCGRSFDNPAELSVHLGKKHYRLDTIEDQSANAGESLPTIDRTEERQNIIQAQDVI